MTKFLCLLLYNFSKEVIKVNKKRKGAITMTEVLTNVEYIMDNYQEEQLEKDNKITKAELILLVYKIKRIVKSKCAQKIIKENIIKDKTINEGRYTIKGTRITPDDIGRIICSKDIMTIEDIYKEYPSLKKDEQIMAGIFFYVQKNITYSKVLLNI